MLLYGMTRYNDCVYYDCVYGMTDCDSVCNDTLLSDLLCMEWLIIIVWNESLRLWEEWLCIIRMNLYEMTHYDRTEWLIVAGGYN